MKIIFALTLLAIASISTAQATEKRIEEISFVNSAAYNMADGSTLKMNYSTGGCGEENNHPLVSLEFVSSKDITSKYALSKPNAIHEFHVILKVVLKEEVPAGAVCAMAYDINVSANLRQLFERKAPTIGIDLPAKKAHYLVEFIAPPVKGSTAFSAF